MESVPVVGQGMMWEEVWSRMAYVADQQRAGQQRTADIAVE